MVRASFKGFSKVNFLLDLAISQMSDLRPILKVVSEKVSKKITTGIKKGGVPEKYSLNYNQDYLRWKKRKYNHTKPLILTGRLLKSLGGGTSDTIDKVDKRTFSFGTKVPYAKYLQHGTSKMVARPPIQLKSSEIEKMVVNEIEKYLRGEG